LKSILLLLLLLKQKQKKTAKKKTVQRSGKVFTIESRVES
jgi:hypothetical protein